MDADSERVTSFKLRCQACGAECKDPEEQATIDPCPSCGGTALVGELLVTDTGTLEARTVSDQKFKEGGKGKPVKERRVGDSYWRNRQKWVRKDRLIDRERDEYQEVVTDPETGKEIHRCEEPLSKHCGHGSAAARRPKEGSQHPGDGEGEVARDCSSD